MTIVVNLQYMLDRFDVDQIKRNPREVMDMHGKRKAYYYIWIIRNEGRMDNIVHQNTYLF